MNISKQTKLLAVIGNPIKHSLSPVMQNHAIQSLHLNSLYTRFMLPKNINKDDLKDFITHSSLSGVNITLPFKEIAFEIVDKADGIANAIRAINTIVKKDSKLIGYNTDTDGFYNSIKQYNPKHILLLGAGGSAKSIATILYHNNIKISIANRSIEKLRFFENFGETMDLVELSKKKNIQYDIIVNATSASVNNELPLKEEVLKSLFRHCNIAYDLMYLQDSLTPFCEIAKQENIKFFDGKAMLVYQGALALLHFHDMDITDNMFMEVSNIMAESLHVKL